jgi:DNA-binding NarL/FixJ family response regulator
MSAATMSAPNCRAARPSSSDRPTRPLTIVVADDSPVYSAPLVRRIDAEPGLTVVRSVASTGEAVAAVRELRPDLVLLDVRMPGGGGLAAARELAKDRRVHGLRIALMTGDPATRRLVGGDGDDASLVDGVIDKALSRRAIIDGILSIAGGGGPR